MAPPLPSRTATVETKTAPGSALKRDVALAHTIHAGVLALQRMEVKCADAVQPTSDTHRAAGAGGRVVGTDNDNDSIAVPEEKMSGLDASGPRDNGQNEAWATPVLLIVTDAVVSISDSHTGTGENILGFAQGSTFPLNLYVQCPFKQTPSPICLL